MATAALAGGGALLGAVQNHQKEVNYNRQKELAAQTEQYSPWTHLHADQAALNSARPDALGGVLQGAMTGAMMGQSLGGGAAAPAAAGASGPMASGAPMQGFNQGGQAPMAGGPMDQMQKPSLFGSPMGNPRMIG